MAFPHNLMRASLSALIALTASAMAGVLAVYGPRGTDTEVLKRSAESLRSQMKDRPAEGISGALTWRWTPGSVLGPDFSFGAQEAAYFLTEKGVHFGPGFFAKGPAGFGAVPADAKPTFASPPMLREALKVSRSGDRLMLGYPLSEAGRVSIDVYSMDGTRFARWKGSQEAGSHLQPVLLPRRAAGKVLIVHWRFRDAVRVQRVNP